MHTRTRHSIVSFHYPFSLSGVDGVQPAGEYSIAEDDEIPPEVAAIVGPRPAFRLLLPTPQLNALIEEAHPLARMDMSFLAQATTVDHSFCVLSGKPSGDHRSSRMPPTIAAVERAMVG